METCPKCGKWLKFNMDYCCGEPYIYYTCECGYHSSNDMAYGTTTTEKVWRNKEKEDYYERKSND